MYDKPRWLISARIIVYIGNYFGRPFEKSPTKYKNTQAISLENCPQILWL